MVEGSTKRRRSALTLGKLWVFVLVAGGVTAYRVELNERRVKWESDLRLARQAYDPGEGDRALEILDGATDRWTWPAEERAELVETRVQIAEVTQQFERGIAAFKADRAFEALDALNEVRELERRPENAYHRRAVK